jgi:putative ABC transport system substrate-binding protein
MLGKRAQAGQKHAAKGGASRAANRLSRRDLVLSLARWSASTAGLALVGGCQLATPLTATPATVRRVGFLYVGTHAIAQPSADAFLDRLRQLGWVEGENLTIEWRFGEGNSERMPEPAAELVQLPVTVILAAGGSAALPAQQATSKIPIVGVSFDPIALGMADSYGHPGGNVTGVANGGSVSQIKSVELLKSTLPQLSHLAVLGDPSNSAYIPAEPLAARTAQDLGIQVLHLDVHRVEDVDGAIAAAHGWGAEALLVIGTTEYTAGVYARVAELAAQARLPAMFPGVPYAVHDNGGLMSYGRDLPAAYQQGAEYVDKILRGASPADLPIIEPREWQFVVNVKAARALGLTFPPDAALQVTEWVQ